jgi:tetraacyldisaccharide 4'-kinase
MLNFALSLIWSIVNSIRRFAYQLGIFKSENLGVRTISVGNLQSGGSGKTPFVVYLANEAHKRGKRVCILHRGYGSQSETLGAVVYPKNNPLYLLPAASLVGDEVALLSGLCPNATLCVGAKRGTIFKKLLNSKDFDLVILDDGFQHLQIRRDLDFLLLTSKKWGEVLYREFSSQASHADLCFWLKGKSQPKTFGSPLIVGRYETTIQGEFLKTDSFILVSGVGDNKSFFDSVEKLGFDVKERHSFSDHHAYTLDEVISLKNLAKLQAARIGITAKDLVKWQELKVKIDDVVSFDLTPVFDTQEDLFREVLWGK